MTWTCPSCGFDQNNESGLVCVCGFRYTEEIADQEKSERVENPLIKICGANSSYLLVITIFLLPLAITAIFLGVLLVDYKHFTVANLLILLTILCSLSLVVLLPRACWQAFNACTTIDRKQQIVTVKKGSKSNSYHIGKFLEILIQPVQIPMSGLQYHAYLVGTEGKCHLEIVAGAKGRLLTKIQPISQFLAIPTIDAQTTESFKSVLNR